MTLAEYLEQVKARRERFLELCDSKGQPLDEQSAHDAILEFDSNAPHDIEILVKMVELLRSQNDALAYDDRKLLEPMDRALEALVPEEKL